MSPKSPDIAEAVRSSATVKGTTTQQCPSRRHTHLPVEKPEMNLEKISDKKSYVKILKVELKNSSNDSNDPKNPVSKVKNL